MNTEILQMNPVDLLRWLVESFSVDMPKEIITSQDMKKASKTLLELSAHYSYLLSMCSLAKIVKRDTKRNGTKEEYENMVDREELIQNMTEVVKHQYNSISRAVTIYIENANELKMLGMSKS